jgi:glutamyl-tRNA reductase
MPDFKIIHRAFSNSDDSALLSSEGLLWKTCLRQICLSDTYRTEDLKIQPKDEIYHGLEADSFLAEVLCGLKSPLVGETEVFGQFKNWWKTIPTNHPLKEKFRARIEALFALVKTVREKALCGHGSQSYGSLLRKNLVPNEAVDIVGAGHLAQEILPWIQNKSVHRIWCRNPEKAKSEIQSDVILSLQDTRTLSTVVVVAAPLSHDELNIWLRAHGFTASCKLFDFRSDSATFEAFVKPALHLKLRDFSSEFDVHQAEIQRKAADARAIIQSWKQNQETKSQVRPFGWEDL